MTFLFVDRILQLTPGKSIKGIKHVTQDDFYLCDDGTGNPCFMPSLIGETLGQLAAWNVMSTNGFTKRPVAGIVASAQLLKNVAVGETILLESNIESLDEQAVQYNSQARVGSELVFSVEGALGPLLPMNDFISESEIRRQFNEINRPGDWPPVLNDTGIKIQNAAHMTSFQFDRILSDEPGVGLTAEKRITRASPWVSDHFPHKPVLPLTVLLECQIQLARTFIERAEFKEKYRLSTLQRIKMKEFVELGDVVECSLKVKSRTESELLLAFHNTVNGKRICVVEMVFTI